MGKGASGEGAPRWMVVLLFGLGALVLVGVPVLTATVDRPLILYILGSLLVVVLVCSVPLAVVMRRELREIREKKSGR